MPFVLEFCLLLLLRSRAMKQKIGSLGTGDDASPPFLSLYNLCLSDKLFVLMIPVPLQLSSLPNPLLKSRSSLSFPIHSPISMKAWTGLTPFKPPSLNTSTLLSLLDELIPKLTPTLISRSSSFTPSSDSHNLSLPCILNVKQLSSTSPVNFDPLGSPVPLLYLSPLSMGSVPPLR